MINQLLDRLEKDNKLHLEEAEAVLRADMGIEVFLGYLMLGGLISIFANKFARRS